jgi:hypothetical protein
MNNSTLDSILKTAIMKTVDAYPLEAFHANTDGSAFKAILNVTYGAVMYPDVYPADNIALQKSQLWQRSFNILVDFKNSSITPEDFVVFLFSDSKSAL